MEFSRRAFIASLVGGSLISLGSPALANAPDRYKQLVKKQIELYDSADLFHQKVDVLNISKWDDERIKDDLNVLCMQTDAFMHWTMDAFPQIIFTAEIRAQVDAIFDGRADIDALDDEQLRKLEDPLVVISVFKHMCRIKQVPFNAVNGAAERFATVYRRFVQ